MFFASVRAASGPGSPRWEPPVLTCPDSQLGFFPRGFPAVGGPEPVTWADLARTDFVVSIASVAACGGSCGWGCFVGGVAGLLAQAWVRAWRRPCFPPCALLLTTPLSFSLPARARSSWLPCPRVCISLPPGACLLGALIYLSQSRPRLRLGRILCERIYLFSAPKDPRNRG